MEQQLIGMKIKCITNLMRRRLENNPVFRECDNMTNMHGWVIGFLAHQTKDVFQRDIEQRFNIRRSTVTKMLQAMEKNGFITRESVDTDGRLKRILLTQKAKSLHVRIEEQISETEKILIKGIKQEKLAEVFDVLSIMAKNLSEDSEEVKND